MMELEQAFSPNWIVDPEINSYKAWWSPIKYRAGWVAESWDQPDPRWIIGLYWLTGKLHPKLIASAEVEKKVTEFYRFVYGLSPQRIEEAVLPKIRGDYP